jgi:hypothetical protein
VTAAGAPRRRKAAQPAPAVILRGRPARLAMLPPASADPASVDLAAMPVTGVALQVEGLVPERVHLRRPREPGAPAQLRVRLAPTTPPGRYEGAATVGDRTVPVIIEVEPAARLRATPTRFETTAEPGGTNTVEVALVNTGNVAVDIPARSSFCLFDGGGIDHAVWAALTADPPEGKGRMDVLLDDLAVSHGGLVDVRVRDGAGSLAPGERRLCRIDLGWADRLRPGRTYAGSWEVAGLRLPIRVRTASAKATGAGRATIARRAR